MKRRGVLERQPVREASFLVLRTVSLNIPPESPAFRLLPLCEITNRNIFNKSSDFAFPVTGQMINAVLPLWEQMLL